MMAFEDSTNEGNSPKYHTGKKCIESGCSKPAGTYWGKFWCFEHNVERIHRIDKELSDIISSREYWAKYEAQALKNAGKEGGG
jgi:hypothetical protein